MFFGWMSLCAIRLGAIGENGLNILRSQTVGNPFGKLPGLWQRRVFAIRISIEPAEIMRD